MHVCNPITQVSEDACYQLKDGVFIKEKDYVSKNKGEDGGGKRRGKGREARKKKRKEGKEGGEGREGKGGEKREQGKKRRRKEGQTYT